VSTDPRYAKKARKQALPFFSVDTVEEAESLVVALCSHRDGKYYYGSFFRPWTGELSELPEVQKEFKRIQEMRAARKGQQ
jgi:hypothetical protein